MTASPSIISSTQRRRSGFTLGEVLIALALAAAVVTAVTVAYGTMVRSTPRTSNFATVTLSNTLINAYYGLGGSTITSPVAPNYGALARAEMMREKFLADTLGSTAVFCLSRNTDRPNTYHPQNITHNPVTDTIQHIDSSQSFRTHLINKSFITTADFPDVRSYSLTAPSASIFVLTYSSIPNTSTGGTGNLLRVKAVYDIDLNRSNSPVGYYASVKRWAASASSPATLTDYYDIFYPLSTTASGVSGTWASTNDSFVPLWVAFERNLSTETGAADYFKKAREHPFYFIWWPDPAARDLSLRGGSTNAFSASDPRKYYNLMAGRTAFMFTIPVFEPL